jgi:hydroxymethylglutaryl-CoA reductase (NADPH)
MGAEEGLDDLDAVVADLVAGRRGFNQLPKGLTADQRAGLRRRALEEGSSARLDHVSRYTLDAEMASSRHCENFIGAVQVPLGIVGPLLVRGDVLDREVMVPLATTEAALLASVNRGCRAIGQAGGASVHVEDIGMTRAPVFRTGSGKETREFLAWVRENEDEIRSLAEGTSRYLRLLEIRPAAIGTTVFLRFRFQTGDAMGMNMATLACDRVIRDLISPATGVACIALSGNYCVDKKPATINFHEGRGKRVQADVLIPPDTLSAMLKTTVDELVEVQYRKNLIGSIAAGSMGYNSHTANILASLYLATGQDLAHVVEGSMAITTIEARGEEGVLFSVYLPAVPVGAVGGGTGLQTQSECLSILGIEPDPERPGSAARGLAEVAGATVLAGEISLMSALASGDLARAHERLARGGPA